MYVTVFAVSLVFVIMFHEFGHYATAKLFGMKVERFFLGFGPTLWSLRRGETEYGVKAIPAGGFVKIIGMNDFEEVDPADRDRTFSSKTPWRRAIVLAAGSATHFVVAACLVFAALALVGLPNDDVPPTSTIGLVVAGSPAAGAGLSPGDRIVAVDGRAVRDFEQVRSALRTRGGEPVALTLARDGVRREVEVVLDERDPDGRPGGFLGVGPKLVVETLPPGDALRGVFAGDYSVPRVTAVTLSGLGQVFSPAALSRWFSSIDDPGPRDPNGPVSLVGAGQLVNSAGSGGDIFAVLLILAQLNIVLGTLNMLPLPPLDGGHLAVMLIEEGVNAVRRLRGRSASWRVDPAVITPVALVVILFFVALSFTALYVDIVKPASDLLRQ
ncbi:MAG: site-2 protease family protein [Euzebyales bacterium]|nr:site-2 protease family protein [Euzebyales bacterium]